MDERQIPIPLEEAAGLSGPLAFNIMLKPAGSLCNLGCAYCYYLDKSGIYGGREPRMTLPVLERVTRECIEANDVSEVHFVWHGGEPLVMGLDFFRKAVEFQRRYAGGKRIQNSVQTNGTLLTDEWARFFRDHDFLVGISLDGPRDIHDRFRLDLGGRPSFDQVMVGLEKLKEHGVEFNTLRRGIQYAHYGESCRRRPWEGSVRIFEECRQPLYAVPSGVGICSYEGDKFPTGYSRTQCSRSGSCFLVGNGRRVWEIHVRYI